MTITSEVKLATTKITGSESSDVHSFQYLLDTSTPRSIAAGVAILAKNHRIFILLLFFHSIGFQSSPFASCEQTRNPAASRHPQHIGPSELVRKLPLAYPSFVSIHLAGNYKAYAAVADLGILSSLPSATR